MSIIAVVSAGSFGTALAHVLSLNGHNIRLHVRETDTFYAIDKRGNNPRYLPNVKLDTRIRPIQDIKKAVEGADFILLAVPTQSVAETVNNFPKDVEKSKVTIILTSKGLAENGVRMSEIVRQRLPKTKVCGLYGITFSKLIAEIKGFSSLCIASPNKSVAEIVSRLFTQSNKSENFRIYLSTDLRGAEFGGAMKNVYALAMGIFDGHLESAGANKSEELLIKAPRHSLLSLCMMEFVKFGLAYGARIGTLIGPSGVGDIQASSNKLSRNYRYGSWMATLKTVENPGVPPDLHEGYDTVKAAFQLAKKYTIDKDTPILKTVHDILFTESEIKDAIPQLLKKLSITIDVNEEDKFNNEIIKSIERPIEPIEPTTPNKTAFISYCFTPEYKKYVSIIESVCKLFGIVCITGEAVGATTANKGISDNVTNRIKGADLYIGIFLNDKSDKYWLITERTIAINFKKRMLIFVERGTPKTKISKYYPDQPYHLFTEVTFASEVEKQFKSVTGKE